MVNTEINKVMIKVKILKQQKPTYEISEMPQTTRVNFGIFGWVYGFSFNKGFIPEDSQIVINKDRAIGGKDVEVRHSLWHRIHILVKRMTSIQWYHILQTLNQSVDSQANKGAKQQMGELIVNGTIKPKFIPP